MVHCLINRTDQDALYLEVGTRSEAPNACIIPTSTFTWSATCRVGAGCADARSRNDAHAACTGHLPTGARQPGNGEVDGLPEFQARRRRRRHCARSPGTCPSRSMNVIDVNDHRGTRPRSSSRSPADAAIKGAVVTSGKETFSGGADLTLLESLSRTFTELAKAQGEEAAASQLFDRKPQAVADLPADRDLRQAVGRRDQRHRARRRLRTVPRLPPAHRRRQRQDPRRPARGQDRPVSRRRRHAAHRAHDAAGRCVAVPAQGRPASPQPRQGA